MLTLTRNILCLIMICLTGIGFSGPFQSNDHSSELLTEEKSKAECIRYLSKYIEITRDPDAIKLLEGVQNGSIKFAVENDKSGKPIYGYYAINHFGVRFALAGKSLNWIYSTDIEDYVQEELLSVAKCEDLAKKYALISYEQSALHSIEREPIKSPSARYVHFMVRQKNKSGFLVSSGLYLTISRITGRITDAQFPYPYDCERLSVEKLLSEEQCLNSAFDAYQRFRPFQNAILFRKEKVIGSVLRVSNLPNEMSGNHKGLIKAKIGIPYYKFVVAEADTRYTLYDDETTMTYAYGKWQTISVDARSGQVMTIIPMENGNAGLVIKPLEPMRLDKLKSLSVVGVKGHGSVKFVKTSTTSEPSGVVVFIHADKMIEKAKYDSESRLLWVQHKGTWTAYSPDKALGSLIQKAIRVKQKSFGTK